MPARTKVFISYSHADRRFLDRLRVFLKPLERDGRIEWWDDTRLKAGSKWRTEIKTAVDSARVAVLLISADFFASDFIYKNELPPLLEAAARDEAVLLSVVLQPVDFGNSQLSEIQAVNDPARPLGRLRTRAERDEVWVRVTKAIEAALDKRPPPRTTKRAIASARAALADVPTDEPPDEPVSRQRKTKRSKKLPTFVASPAKKKPEVDRSFFQVTWWRAIELWDEFKSCRLSLISIGIGLFFFLGPGLEVLRVIGEGGAGGQWFWPRVFGFFAAVLLWAICNWYTARALFYFDFPGVRRRIPSTGSWDTIIDTLQRSLPRLLGAAPFLVVCLGFLGAAQVYESGSTPKFWLYVFAFVSLVLAIVFYLILILRRKWVGRMPARELQSLGELDKGRLFELGTIGGGTFLVSLLLLLLFTVSPVTAAQNLSPGLILCFAMSSWVTLGSVLVYLGSRHQLPAISMALLLALLCARWNDNHLIRMLPAQEGSRRDVIQSFDQWYALVEKNDSAGARHPLYVVAAEGGGIRAAYWTALILSELQDSNPTFASHLFAISGVSGGSLGATVFDALLAENQPPFFKFKDKADEILSQDFLSPALGSMLYPDFVQTFLPFPVPYFDRGRALELAWEKGWRGTMGNNRFGDSFVDLWKTNSREWMPSLFLNGASVETGRRIITSNLRLTRIFLDAEDAAAKLAEYRLPATKAACNIPVSTAVNMSFRHFLSPAGRFADGSHVVEGGSFETSGATTAMEIVTRVKDLCRFRKITNVDVKVILISNDPLTNFLAVAPANPGSDSKSPKQAPAVTIEGRLYSDLLAYFVAVLNARDARGFYAQQATRHELRRFKADEVEQAPAGTPDILSFGLRETSAPLPVGWMLSREAARAMRDQLYLNDGFVRNGQAIDEILRSLPAPAPTPAP